jgi:hypothetical protein
MNQARVACPNCEQMQDGDAILCQNCGMALRPDAPKHDKRKLITGNWIGDVFLGFVLNFLSFFIVIGVITAPIVYFTMRDSKPFFARGAGIATLLMLLILLGAILACFGWLRF